MILQSKDHASLHCAQKTLEALNNNNTSSSSRVEKKNRIEFFQNDIMKMVVISSIISMVVVQVDTTLQEVSLLPYFLSLAQNLYSLGRFVACYSVTVYLIFTQRFLGLPLYNNHSISFSIKFVCAVVVTILFYPDDSNFSAKECSISLIWFYLPLLSYLVTPKLLRFLPWKNRF